MTPAWAQRQEELLRDCIVSPDVFDHMIERLRAFVVPYQHALETEAGKRNVHLYLQGLLSHLPRKNAEDIATLVDVERLVMQEFIGTAPWDHRLVIEVLIEQVVDRLGEPDGTLGTVVTQSGTVHTITGGTRPGNGPNLFHSFDRFSVGTNDTARFRPTVSSSFTSVCVM